MLCPPRRVAAAANCGDPAGIDRVRIFAGQTEDLDIVIGECLEMRAFLLRARICVAHQVRKPALKLEIVCYRAHISDRHNVGDRTAINLDQRKKPAFDGPARDFNCQRAGVTPAKGAGAVNHEEGWAFDAHRVAHFALQIGQEGDGSGGRIRNVMGRDDRQQVLFR